MELRNFRLSEFDSPDKVGSSELMDADFLTMLDNARDLANTPFRITSGVRSEAHNKAVGGVSDSSHLKGYACDIAASSSREKFLIVDSLIKSGFNRIGIAKNFIHVDNDPNKVANVIWTY